MKDQETIQKFIELRSQGLSYRAISNQLGVATSTLVGWSQQHHHEIHNLQAIAWEDFLERTLASKQERVQTLAAELRRLEEELAKRDLTEVPTSRLHGMVEETRRRLERECGTLQFSAGVQIGRDDQIRDVVQEWQP